MRKKIKNRFPTSCFYDETRARRYLERIIWPDGPVCPHCGGMEKAYRIRGKSVRPGLYKCGYCRKQFTVTVGTIFESSHIPLRKWLHAIYLLCCSKKGISSHQLHRMLDITYKSAWFMTHRIRLAMQESPFSDMLKGTVEVDETYIGGKSREGKTGRGSERKTAVMALVERKGRAVSKPVEHVDSANLKGTILCAVDRNSTIMTDEWAAYHGIGDYFDGGHGVIPHAQGVYARGVVSTNQVESYFSLLKRGVHGIFHHVSKEHLFRYCDEFSFRWSHRKVDDTERTKQAIKGADGKRLMYQKMVRKERLFTEHFK